MFSNSRLNGMIKRYLLSTFNAFISSKCMILRDKEQLKDDIKCLFLHAPVDPLCTQKILYRINVVKNKKEVMTHKNTNCSKYFLSDLKHFYPDAFRVFEV